MAATRRAKNVVAVTPGGKITMEQVLGWLAMYSIPDQAVPASKLMRTWARADLDMALVPDARVPVHAFQVACRSVETRRRENGHGAEVKVDELLEDADICIYQITRMVRDKDKRIIEHPKAMRVIFDKRSSSIDVEPLEKAAFKALAGQEAAIREHFEQNQKTVPGSKVRKAVREALTDLGSTNVMKRSGVYFVPKDEDGTAKATLDTIQQVIGDLYGVSASVWTCPLANDEGERSMVQQQFEVNMTERVEEEIKKIASVLVNGSYVRKDMLRNTITSRKELRELHARYKDLLSEDLEGVEARLGILDKQIDTLVTKADENVSAAQAA